MKSINKMFIIICSMISSYYLLQIIDSITLSTNIQRIFVYVYFGVMVYSIFFSLDKVFYRIAKKENHKIIILASLCLALLLLLIFNHSVIPIQSLNNHLTISTMDKHNKDSKGYDVRLSEILINGIDIPLPNVEINNEKWSYGDEVIWSNAENASLDLYLPKAKSIQLKFVKHPWSGCVSIDNNESYYRTIDLYDYSGDELLLDVSVVRKEFNTYTKLILFMGFYILAFYSIKYLILIVLNLKKKH